MTKMEINQGWFPKAVSYRYKLPYFDIKQIAESGQAFRFYNVAGHEGFSHYYNVSGSKYVEILQKDDEIELLTKPEWVGFWEEYFSINDTGIYEELEKRIQESDDSALKGGWKQAKGIRVLHQDPFETTISFMLSSANSIHNIQLYINRFCKCYGHFEIYNIGEYEVSYWTFPTLECLQQRVTEKDLRALGFGFRAKNIYNFIMNNAGKLDLSSPKDLLSIVGVGEKIKDCILLYSNKDLDRIPMDVWMKKAKDCLYGTEFPWNDFEPYRGICQIYLYYYCRNNPHLF